MTSARNLRLPLSGNRLWVVGLIAIAVQSCWIIKPRPEKPVVVKPSDSTVVVVPRDTPTSPVDTVPHPSHLIFKELYNVAVLLPFSIDDQYITDFDYKDRTTPYRSMVALELYQGIRLALDDLKGSGINIHVHVYDTRNNQTDVSRVLAQPEMKTMDVIIGPLFEHSVRMVADFALRNHIYMISPLGEVEDDPVNPYLICANASIASHVTYVANFINTAYAKRQVVIVRRNDPQEEKLSNLFSERLSALGSRIRPTERVSSGWELFPSGTFGSDTTIVFCPSEDEAFVNEVTRQLMLASDKHPIILVGMPSWLSKFESLQFAFLDQLNFHVTSSLWVDTSNPLAEQLAEAYRERYGIAPSELVYRGYDLMNWVALLMKNFGISFAGHFNDAPQDKLLSRFYILPANHDMNSLNAPPINYYENQNVQVLRYKGHELVKVN